MIELTVKTLDSQNHAFTLEDDITVRGFKEYIAESVAVPADSQRLIYCGRVLQDDKKLNDYDVNGKVIHLVQRAPPQSGQRGNSNAQSQSNNQNWPPSSQRGHFRHARTPVHGNAMYLGAMSVPAEIVEGHGLLSPTLSNTLSSGRLIIARRMLQKANQLIDRIEDPSLPLNPNTNERNSPPLAEPIQLHAVETVHGEDNNGGPILNRTRLAQAASTAIAAAFSAVGLNNVTVLRAPNDEGTEEEISVNDTSDNQGGDSSEQANASEQGTSSNNERQNRQTQIELPRPPQMAELLERLLNTQDRLRPYIERYRTLMATDPSFSPRSESGVIDEHQRIIDGVSESLHYLSHASHALSDIIVDMSQQPPRNLRCRPILVQHSAVLQAGIPIQVEAHITLPGRTSSNNNNENDENDSNAQSASRPSNSTESSSTSNEENQRRSETTNVTQQSHINLTHSPFGSVFNLPNNVEVLMEMSPENTMESGSGVEQNQSNGSNNNNNAGSARVTAGGAFPWSGVSSPDFLHNLMQAVAGHVVQGGVAPTLASNVNFSTVTGSQMSTVGVTIDSNTTNSGQSTQARSNVGTHPTTATQTRSTSRPHVFHPHPLGLGGLGTNMEHGLVFDPFLPCNSHHVRRTPNDTSRPTTTASSQTNQQNQTFTAESQSQAQSAQPSSTANDSTTSNMGNANETQQNITVNPFLNILQQILDDEEPEANGVSIDLSIGDLQRLAEGNIPIGFVQAGGSGVRRITLADLLDSTGMGMTTFPTQNGEEREDNFLVDLLLLVARNITLGEFFGLRLGRWAPIGRLRQPLLDFFRRTFRNTPDDRFPTVMSDHLLLEITPHIENLLAPEEVSNTRVNLLATVTRLLRASCFRIISHILFSEQRDDETFGTVLQRTVECLGQNLCFVLQHLLKDGQRSLENVASRLVTGMMVGVHPSLREWVIDSFMTQFRSYIMGVPQPPDYAINRLLVYKANAPENRSYVVSNASEREFEPMEVEEVMIERVVNDTLPAAEGDEDVPETFPRHEVLPVDWVPVIARDGVRQRRQVQSEGAVTPFSDAYLGSLPSKRRKVVEQQKPRLLVSPTPNSSTITASIERLVKEGINHAGVEEVEGAAAAVASDPSVRNIFGQAIKECLQPKKQSPDFPNAKRFPNATKYFAADQDRSTKQ